MPIAWQKHARPFEAVNCRQPAGTGAVEGGQGGDLSLPAGYGRSPDRVSYSAPRRSQPQTDRKQPHGQRGNVGPVGPPTLLASRCDSGQQTSKEDAKRVGSDYHDRQECKHLQGPEPERLGLSNIRRRYATTPKTTAPQPPNTPSDNPSTTNSTSSVRKLNWKGGLGGGEGWDSGTFMSSRLRSDGDRSGSRRKHVCYFHPRLLTEFHPHLAAFRPTPRICGQLYRNAGQPK